MVEISYILASGETDFVRVDAVSEEQHRSSATITEHPVEDGGDISDHIRADQDTLQLTIFVSNAPIRAPEGIAGAVRNQDLFFEVPPHRLGGAKLQDHGRSPTRLPLGGLVPGRAPKWLAQEFAEQSFDSASASVLTFDDEFDRVAQVYDLLLSLFRGGVLLRVATSLRTYEDMLIEEMSTPRDAQIGDGMKMDLTLRQVRIVETTTVEVAPLPAEDRGRRQRANGSQAADEATPAEGEQASLWHRLGELLP